MVNRLRNRDILTNGPGKHLVTFGVAPAGAGAPTLVENGSKAVASVARTGVGVIVITLADKYLALAGVQVTVQLATAAATLVIVTGAATVATNRTITITTMAEAAGTFAAADIAANAANILHVTLTLRDSTAT